METSFVEKKWHKNGECLDKLTRKKEKDRETFSSSSKKEERKKVWRLFQTVSKNAKNTLFHDSLSLSIYLSVCLSVCLSVYLITFSNFAFIYISISRTCLSCCSIFPLFVWLPHISESYDHDADSFPLSSRLENFFLRRIHTFEE